MVDHPVVVGPNSFRILSIRYAGVAIVHPDVVAVGGAVDPGYLDPDVRVSAFVPQLDLVCEHGGTICIDEADVLAYILGQAIVDALLEELELMGYLEIQEGKVSANQKAERKLAEFKASLSSEEREALNI